MKISLNEVNNNCFSWWELYGHVMKRRICFCQTGMHNSCWYVPYGCIHVHRYSWLFKKKKWYNNTIKTWIWQGILHSVECMYYTVHVRPFVSKIAFGFAFIVKNVYRYVKHFRDWSFLWKTEMFDNAMTWHHTINKSYWSFVRMAIFFSFVLHVIKIWWLPLEERLDCHWPICQHTMVD